MPYCKYYCNLLFNFLKCPLLLYPSQFYKAKFWSLQMVFVQVRISIDRWRTCQHLKAVDCFQWPLWNQGRSFHLRKMWNAIHATFIFTIEPITVKIKQFMLKFTFTIPLFWGWNSLFSLDLSWWGEFFLIRVFWVVQRAKHLN